MVVWILHHKILPNSCSMQCCCWGFFFPQHNCKCLTVINNNNNNNKRLFIKSITIVMSLSIKYITPAHNHTGILNPHYLNLSIAYCEEVKVYTWYCLYYLISHCSNCDCACPCHGTDTFIFHFQADFLYFTKIGIIHVQFISGETKICTAFS